MRLVIVILLLANVLLAAYLLLTADSQNGAAPSADLNPEQLKPVPFAAARSAPPSLTAPVPELQAPAAPAAPAAAIQEEECLEWSGLTRAEAPRARAQLARLAGDASIVERRIEEPTRFWVYIPPSDDAGATVARLKEAGFSDVARQPDQSISLGLFGSIELASRHMNNVHGKGFTDVRIEPRAPQVRQVAFFVKPAPADLAERLEASTKELAGVVRVAPCPAAAVAEKPG